LALDEVRRSLGYIVGKRATAPDGRTVQIDLTGPVEAELRVAVAERANVVDHLERPDVVVRLDFLTFTLLACGRLDPEGALSSGDLELGGTLRRPPSWPKA
jgi:hypothetical protein